MKARRERTNYSPAKVDRIWISPNSEYDILAHILVLGIVFCKRKNGPHGFDHDKMLLAWIRMGSHARQCGPIILSDKGNDGNNNYS